MKAATAREMREIDRQAIAFYKIPEIALMENAGAEVKKAVEKLIGDPRGKRICVFAGRGNNGGDGFAAARHLSSQGAKVKVYCVGAVDEAQGSAKINLEILRKLDLPVKRVEDERDWDKVKIALAFCDCLVDGLLGTGFQDALRPEMERMINMINEARKPVVSIDLPSGVDADTGKVASAAVRANLTVTFGLVKPGLLFYPGAAYAGEILVQNIGLPKVLLEDEHIKQNLINTNTVKRLLSKRLPDLHKGNCGKVLVVAGSTGLTGAAVLCAKAALRAGAGVVTLAVAQSLHDIVEAKLTEVMTHPLPEVEAGAIGESALPKLLELAQGYDAVAIGCGLGRNPSTFQLVREFVRQTDRQLILDADAINAYQSLGAELREAKVMPILTPHLGEMAKLIDLPVREIKDDLVSAARLAAENFNSIFVLKSARTVVAYPDGSVYINIRGNSGMATAGSGDVLTGVISGLFAQGLLSYSAATAGVYLHAAAGDTAASAGLVGLIAGDIIKALPSARKELEA